MSSAPLGSVTALALHLRWQREALVERADAEDRGVLNFKQLGYRALYHLAELGRMDEVRVVSLEDFTRRLWNLCLREFSAPRRYRFEDECVIRDHATRLCW